MFNFLFLSLNCWISGSVDSDQTLRSSINIRHRNELDILTVYSGNLSRIHIIFVPEELKWIDGMSCHTFTSEWCQLVIKIKERKIKGNKYKAHFSVMVSVIV